MSIVKDAGGLAFRDYITNGVPGSGKQKVVKAEVRRAFEIVERFMQIKVVSATTTAQPASPVDGALYILPSGKTGAQWAGMAAGSIAMYETANGWTEVVTVDGWQAYAADTQRTHQKRAGAWVWTDSILTSSLDTDPLLTADSDARVAAQKAVRRYINDLRQPNIVDQITNLTTRANVRAFTHSASLSAAIQAACDAAAPTGADTKFPTGRYPIDDSIVTSNVSLSGAKFVDANNPYGNRGSVIEVTSTTKNGIKLTSGSFTLQKFSINYPNQGDGGLIEYPAFITNASATSTLAGVLLEDLNVYGAWRFAKFGGVETFNKAGLVEVRNFRGAVLDTYFELSHCLDTMKFVDGLAGINVQGDDFLHFGAAGAGGIINITSITRSGSLVTVNTATAHGLTMDSNPAVRGINEAGYNGENIKLASVPTATSFTYDIGAATPATPGTGTGKVHNFRMRDKARDAKFFDIWGDGKTDTLATASVDGLIVSGYGFYGGGTVYHIRGDNDLDQGGFLQIAAHTGGAIDAWRKLLKVEPGGCVYTFSVNGVTGFQERVGDPWTFDYYMDVDNPAPGRDASNNPIALADFSFTNFEYGFMRGGLLSITGPYVKRVTISGACANMLHCRTAGDRYAVIIDTPNAIVDIDMRLAGASHLTTGLRKFVHVTANATNAVVRIKGVYKAWDQIITNNSASADVSFDGAGIGMLGEAIGGTYAANVRCSTKSVFDLHPRAFNPLRLRGVYQAVNGIEIGGAPGGGRPYVGTEGDDTSIGWDLISKGVSDFASSISLKPGGFAGLTVRAVNNAVNFFYVLPAATGGSVFFGALGTDADINMVIAPKGVGKFYCAADALPLNNNTQRLGNSSFRWAGVSLGAGAAIDFNGDMTITHSTDLLTIDGGQVTVSNAAGLPLKALNTIDAALADGLRIAGDRATPTNNDALRLVWELSNAAGVQKDMADIVVYGTTLTNGAEYSRMDFRIMLNGTLTAQMRLNATLLAPIVSGAMALGSTSLMWNGVCLSANSALNWNNGNMLVQHSTNLLTFSGSGPVRFASAIIITPGASGVTPPNDGDIMFEFTSSTQLKIKGKAGGTVREASLTLA